MCRFEITWLAGPNLRQRHIVHCDKIYLPGFGSIEKHPVLKKATQFLKSGEYGKPGDIDKEVVPINSIDVWKNTFPNHLVRSSNERKSSSVVIVEDDNGYIVCSTQ